MFKTQNEVKGIDNPLSFHFINSLSLNISEKSARIRCHLLASRYTLLPLVKRNVQSVLNPQIFIKSMSTPIGTELKAHAIYLPELEML